MIYWPFLIMGVLVVVLISFTLVFVLAETSTPPPGPFPIPSVTVSLIPYGNFKEVWNKENHKRPDFVKAF